MEDTSNSSAAPIGGNDTPETQASSTSVGTPTPMSDNSTQDGAAGDADSQTPDQTQPDQQAQTSQTPDQTAAQFPFPGNQSGPNLKDSVENAGGNANDKNSQPPDPAVQAATRFSTVAEALTGGPKYKTTINPDTGVATRTRVPVSGKDLAFALAFQALGGALAGYGVANGPGNLGRAAAAGGQFGAQQAENVQKNNQQQDQQANADFQRHAQVLETNMRMRNNALTASRMNFDANERNVAQYAPLASMLQKDHPEVVKGVVNEEDLDKYHVTKDQGIPYKTVPVLNPPGTPHAGEQATNSFGEPKWQSSYLILDPNFQGSNLLDDADKAEAQKFKLPGFVDGDGNNIKLPQDIAMKVSMAVGLKSKLAALRLGEQDLNNYYDKLNQHNANGQKPNNVFTMFGATPDGQPDFNKLADFIVKEEGNKTGQRADRNNNPGNLIADKSWNGQVDAANLAPEQHGVGYRVYDSKEEGRAGLIHQLQLDYQRTPNASPEAYFKKYSATNPEGYAQAAYKAAGVGGPQPVSDEQQHPPVDLVAAVAKDPSLPDALGKFQPFLNAASDNYEKAIGALGAKDPQAAAKVLSLYGGTQAVRQFDLKTTQETAQAKTAAKLAQDTAEEDIKANAAFKAETARLKAKDEAATNHAKELVGAANDEQPDSSGVRQNYLASVANSQGQPHADLLKAIAEGAQKVTTMGLSRQQTIDLAAEVRAAFPHYDQSTANNYYDTQKSLQSTKPLDAANTAIGHLGELYDTVDKLGRVATWSPINGFMSNYGSKETRDQLAEYNQVLKRAASEVELAYKNGGASLTDKDQQDAKEMFDKHGWESANPEKMKSMAKRAMDLLTEKYSSVDGRLANVMPSSETPIQDLMTSKAHAAFRLAHDGQDFDAAGQQRDNASKYGQWYGRGQLDRIKTSNGGQAGNQQMQGQTNGQTQQKPVQPTPQPQQFQKLSASGAYGWDGKQWVPTQNPK